MTPDPLPVAPQRIQRRPNRRSRKWTCACGETRREEFRDSEPYRCRACRRAYNAQRKRELRASSESAGAATNGAIYASGIEECADDLEALLASPALAALFQLGDFTLHGGERAGWKIDCDALTPIDWQALAQMLADLLPPFGTVEGVPRGGCKLAAALREHASVDSGPLLIVDDVLTTGASLEAQRAGRHALGAVIFARGVCPAWVTPLFQMSASSALAAQPRAAARTPTEPER